MSVCYHDPHCPGYGPTHERGIRSIPLVESGQPLSNARRKRAERAQRKAERQWYEARP